MRATLLAALCGVLACSIGDVSGPVLPYVVLEPILDSLFVGEVDPLPSVTYFDGRGNSRTPLPIEIRWQSSDTTILSVDSASRRMTARGRGIAIVVATVNSVSGQSLVAVSNALDVRLLLDTVYAMPGDTLTVPVAVKRKNSSPDSVVWYEAPPSNGVYTIDSLTGLLTATGPGGPVPYIVHADSVADTGAVHVLSLSDTIGGQFFFSVLGTANTHVGGSIRAVNYTRSNANLAFQLQGSYPPSGTTLQTVQIILPDSVIAPGAYAIDSLSPDEALAGSSQQPLAICIPPRPWALWSARTGSGSIVAYSRPVGTLSITQIATVPDGRAISGVFTYAAQRNDLYKDPLGVLSIHGSFVAPLVTDRTVCR
ncbi:MAG TPA: hypothetical protein VIW28_06530 [Gemmatimonadales bacterium]